MKYLILIQTKISNHTADTKIEVKVSVFSWSKPNKIARNPPTPILKNKEAFVDDSECFKSNKFFSKEFILT